MNRLPKEVEVLQLHAGGLNNPNIAETLSRSRNTVETHRKYLNRKLDIRSYNKLVKYTLAFDLIQFGSLTVRNSRFNTHYSRLLKNTQP